jgi:hypothetical protein
MSKPKRDPAMNRLRGKLRRQERKARDERASRRKVRRARRAAAYLEQRIAKRQARRKGLDHMAVLDGTPVTLGHKLALLDARRHGWGGVVTSSDRRDKPSWVARFINRLGKSTQKELWEGWINRLRGYLPANPPDRGTHMRIGDGVVGELYEELDWWQQGIDASLASTLRSVLSKLGYDAYRPYASASEEHHTNFRRNPHHRLIERGLV